MRKAARAIIIKDDNFLVMDRDKFGTKYMSLVGGAIEINETNEQAVLREVKEETGLDVNNPRLVIIEDAGDIYGVQYIYLCQYIGGEPALTEGSPEFQINQLGKNLFTPKWIKLSELEQANLLPKELKEQLLVFIKNGFPSEPIELLVQG